MDSSFIPPMSRAKNSTINALFRNYRCPYYDRCLNIASSHNNLLVCENCENKDLVDKDYYRNRSDVP